MISLLGDLVHGTLVLSLPMWLYAVAISRKQRKEFIFPIMALLITVLMNSVLVIIGEGSVTAFGTNYPMMVAGEIRYGVYLQELLNWLRNFSVLFLLLWTTNSFQALHRALLICAIAFTLPMMLLVVMRPDLIGMRRTFIDGIVFGGSIWNIGVRAFISCGWLWVCQLQTQSMTLRAKLVYIGAILLTLVTGLAGVSRAFLVGLIMSVLVFLLHIRKNGRLVTGFIVATSIFILVLVILGDYVIQHYLDRFTAINPLEGGNTRTLIWKSYLSNFKEYWHFGVLRGGIHQYGPPPMFYSPHSAPLSWLVRYGLFAMGAYIGLLLILWQLIRKIRLGGNNQGVFLSAWVVAYVSVSFMNETGFETVETFIGMALTMALVNLLLQQPNLLQTKKVDDHESKHYHLS